MLNLIQTKRSGHAHTKEELTTFINDYTRGTIPDYQVAAWLMAVCFQGMSPQETADLTEAMAFSGDYLNLTALPHTADKHSTGGVGDKTSLVLAPLLTCAGATVAKMSGRGLGHTGGTVDKLESIPGFQSELSEEAFLRQARDLKIVLAGQSRDLAPADKKLYALRDVTATVESLPLIASSIMSKKLASGAQSIVLDIKVGQGAFMKTVADARKLAHLMIDIGKRKGHTVRAVLSSMDAPLRNAIGNALEVREAIDCLQGHGPTDLRELCLVLAEEVLSAAQLPSSQEQLAAMLDDGRAYHMFKTWIEYQGGALEPFTTLPQPQTHTITAAHKGFITQIDAFAIGNAVKLLGGGRITKEDQIDHGVGVVLETPLGTPVTPGQPLATLYHNHKGYDEALTLLENAITIADIPVTPTPLVLEVVHPA